MLTDNFSDRQQYIKRSNELNKPINHNNYSTGTKRKIELDQRLEELSIRNGIIVSGNLVRKNILASLSSYNYSNPYISYMVDDVVSDSESHNDSKKYVAEHNRGKDLINNMKNNNNKYNVNNSNKFNRNI